MPEEKKDSFTFSDKIKSSKPAASKSFGNRISSKIGSNGKPKKTLFERTKRDAPFFIAAIVALLLLPFLYKYSGQVHEEPIATPGSEESIFDPERYGFDTSTTDPDGQIAQLAGRDPLSLIKGWGTPEAEQGVYDADSSLHDGVSDNYVPPTSESNTNIYQASAAPATRAAFRRAATKIKELGGAGMTTRGGGSLAVGPWGGGLKKAASQVGGPSGPRQGPKPVSLQPLQAAGKPSRSSFGQGAAAEARRSKDALSKGNAMQALMDAQMRPVEPGKIGGLTGSDYRGGGNGDLKHAFAYNGIKPWWWDLMAQKHMHDWMWKRGLWQKPITAIVEEIGKGLANFLGQALGCVITGNSDWDPGTLAGAPEGSGKEAKCGELTAADWDKCEECKKYGPFGKRPCKAYLSTLTSDSSMVKKGWDAGNKSEGNFGPVSVRLNCLSNNWGLKGKASRDIGEVSNCADLAVNNRYIATLEANRDVSNWSVYHYVVGVKKQDAASYYTRTPQAQIDMEEVFYMDGGSEFNLSALAYQNNNDYVPMYIESVAFAKKLKDGNFNNNADGTDQAVGILMKGVNNAPVKYTEFLNKLNSGKNFVKANGKSASAGKEGKQWVKGGRCAFPIANITCQYNNKGLTEGYPSAKLSILNGAKDLGESKQVESGGTYYDQTQKKIPPNTKTVQTPNVYEKMKEKFAIFYSIQEGHGQYPVTQPGLKRIEHRDIVPVEGSYHVIARNGVGTPGATPKPVMIRWSVRQCPDVNDGKCNPGTITEAKDVAPGAGTGTPGGEVSVAYCGYFNEGSADSVEPLPPAKPVKEDDDDDGNPAPGAALPGNSGEELDAEVGKTSFAVQITDIPTKAEDRTARTRNAPVQFSGKKLIDACKDAPKDFGKFQVDSSAAQDFVLKIQGLYNKVAKSKGLPEISYKKGKPSLANFVDAANMAQSMGYSGQIAKSAVCKFGQSVGALSEDKSVTGASCFSSGGAKTTCNNLFGSYASYIGVDSSFFPARLMHTGNSGAVPECNPRFNAVNEVNGYAGQKCFKTTGSKYQYGKYNDKGDRSKFEAYIANRGVTYPLAPLAEGISFKRDPKTGDPKIDSKNRAAYWGAYGQVLVGECANVKGDMSVSNVVEYIQAVCTAGLSDKPDHGWDGKNPRYKADNVAVKGGVTNPPPVLTEEEQE